MKRLALFVVVSTCLLAASAPCSSAITTPTSAVLDHAGGLEPTWFAEVQRKLLKDEYGLRDRQGWSGFNRRQRYRTSWRDGRMEMTARDDRWSVGFTLASVGRTAEAHAPAPVTSVSVTGDRLEWKRGSIIEWYENLPEGVEQGFDILERLSGAADQPLVLSLAVDGLVPSLGRSDEVHLIHPSGEHVLSVNTLKANDATGRELACRFEVRDDELRMIVDDAGARYPVIVDPLFVNSYPPLVGDQDGGTLGWSVSTAGDVDGDGFSDVIVGAPFYDGGALDSGAAFVYLGSANGPNTTPAWTGTISDVGAQYGLSVSTAGDVNGDGYSDIVVGAPDRVVDAGIFRHWGFAYVYLGSASGPSMTAHRTYSHAPLPAMQAQEARFGFAVSTAGDVDRDGYHDLVVGAPGLLQGLTNKAGRVHVYLGSTSGLPIAASWTYTGQAPAQSAQVGAAVSMAADVNGDGYGDVIVGAPDYVDSAGDTLGRVLIFHGSSTGLGTSPDTELAATQRWSRFGASVDTAGDLDGDGFADIVIGEPVWQSKQELAVGRVHVHRGGLLGVQTTAENVLKGEVGGETFGASVAWAGDVNGDGYADIIAGAPLHTDSTFTLRGRTVVHLGGPDGLDEDAVWTGLGSADFVELGNAVAMAGDVDGDGWSDIIVGSRYHEPTGGPNGAAFVYPGSSSYLANDPDWAWIGDEGLLGLGERLASAGDVNGDGWPDLIHGRPRWDDPPATPQRIGRVEVHHGGPDGYSTTADWSMLGTTQSGLFGEAIAGIGDVNGDGFADIAISQPQFSNGHIFEGRVVVFHGSASGLSTVINWQGEGDVAQSFFGGALASGDVNGDGFSDLVVGHSFRVSSAGQAAKAHVFLGSPSGLATTAEIVLESDGDADQYGDALAVADVNNDGLSDVFVGARYNPNPAAANGAVFVYHATPAGLPSLPDFKITGTVAFEQLGMGLDAAGDVDGDGFADLVIGAPGFSDFGTGELGLGGIYVHRGSATGLEATPLTFIRGDQAESFLGRYVIRAGDVNGDGFSDIMATQPYWDDAQTNQGRVLLYAGAANGPSAEFVWARVLDVQNNWEELKYADSIATLGDADRDGYSDVVIGSSRWSDRLLDPKNQPGLANNGRIEMFFGNAGGGLRRSVRQMETDQSVPIVPLSRAITDSEVLLDALARSPLGRDQVRVEWEIETLSQGFDGQGLLTTDWELTDAPTVDGSAVALDLTSDLAASGPHRWRARIRSRNPRTWASHWITPRENSVSETDFRIVP